MAELTLEVPGMWADHHVLAVRALLQEEAGVSHTAASSRDAVVRVSYDPAATDPERIATRLREGGYEAAAPTEAAAPPTSKPAWATAGVRVTTTDPTDLSMSGDYRKY
jgi:copper chaperone CopZ